MLSAIAFIISKSWTVRLKSINYEQNKEYREEDFILAISHLISFTWATTYHVADTYHVFGNEHLKTIPWYITTL